ncbi:amidohydrolase family protein [Balneolales bacterium ANBcel1]|nr:amidohydrolase family protein [Balneolales bacterium ANBcel1]
MKDFHSFQKIDAHIHYNSRGNALLKLAEKYRFNYITINTEVPFFPPIDEQLRIATDIRKSNPGRVEFVGSFSVSEWGEDGWLDKAKKDIEKAIKGGARGIKIWKNIGMDLRDTDDSMVMISDNRFTPLLSWMASEGITVIGHLGEPRNCWLPVKSMTTASDRTYFSKHPEYHMYKYPEYPSYEKQLEARDKILARHPTLQFVGAHLASLEWSVEKVAQWLDHHPAAAVDLAERINHLKLQAVVDHWKVVSFFESYQDRIIYGTDIIYNDSTDEKKICRELARRWVSDWKFLSTDDTLSSSEFTGSFQGLNLPKHILEKIYCLNAKRWYGI